MIKKYIILLITAAALASCGTSRYIDTSSAWVDVVVTIDMTYYVDTTSIHREGNFVVAREKRVYEPASRQQYIDHIKERWVKLGNPRKAEAWSDFSYNIYTLEYDCANRQSRIIEVEDYDSTGRRISKTKSNLAKAEWVGVEQESIKDYTFFYVCDYGN